MDLFFVLLVFDRPNMFWALFILIVPILVHLFNLRRAKRLHFSNISLLRKVQEQTSSKKRPIELLILFMRIVGLIALVLAFSGPKIMNTANEKQLSKEVFFYIDNSLSMSVGNGQQTKFEQVFSIIDEIVTSGWLIKK